MAERKPRLALDQVVERTWKPPVEVEAPAEAESVPSVDVFPDQWWVRDAGQFRPNTPTISVYRQGSLASHDVALSLCQRCHRPLPLRSTSGAR